METDMGLCAGIDSGLFALFKNLGGEFERYARGNKERNGYWLMDRETFQRVTRVTYVGPRIKPGQSVKTDYNLFGLQIYLCNDNGARIMEE